jgi:hypothetical protein
MLWPTKRSGYFKILLFQIRKLKKFPAFPLRFSGCPSEFLAKFNMLGWAFHELKLFLTVAKM